DFKRAHLRLGERRSEDHLAAGEGEAFAARHAFDGAGWVAVEPPGDRAGIRIDAHPEAAEGPAFIRDRYKEAGGKAVGGGDLAADQRRLAAEAHGADSEFVGLTHDFVFQLREVGV